MNKIKCDFCKAMIEPTDERACAWMGDKATNWICDKCAGISDAAYEASNRDVENNESQLAEMEAI